MYVDVQPGNTCPDRGRVKVDGKDPERSGYINASKMRNKAGYWVVYVVYREPCLPAKRYILYTRECLGRHVLNVSVGTYYGCLRFLHFPPQLPHAGWQLPSPCASWPWFLWPRRRLRSLSSSGLEPAPRWLRRRLPVDGCASKVHSTPYPTQLMNGNGRQTFSLVVFITGSNQPCLSLLLMPIWLAAAQSMHGATFSSHFLLHLWHPFLCAFVALVLRTASMLYLRTGHLVTRLRPCSMYATCLVSPGLAPS